MADKGPLFSVIIPTYNRSNFLYQTILSLQAQDFKDFELLVIDDGSTDNTEEVVLNIQDSRIIYLKKKNEERAAARNYGAQHAKGVYINFFDSDDLAYSNHLSTAKDFINNNSSPAIFHLHYDIKEKTDQAPRQIKAIRNINDQIISGNLLSCNGVFMQKELALENPFNQDRDLSALEDWELWIRMASRFEFKHSPLVTTSVIHHADRSVFTADQHKIQKKAELFVRYVFADAVNIKVYGKKLRKTEASTETYVALHLAIAKSSNKHVLRHLVRGVSKNPGEILKKRFFVTLKLILLSFRV